MVFPQLKNPFPHFGIEPPRMLSYRSVNEEWVFMPSANLFVEDAVDG